MTVTEVRKQDYTAGITEVRERVFRITDMYEEINEAVIAGDTKEIAWKLAEQALEFTGALCSAELALNSKGVWYLRTIEA